MSAHARLSPSAAERWFVCPGSVRILDTMPEDRSSEFAAEGTVAHEVRELCLRYGFEPFDFIGQTFSADGFSFVVTEEMADFLTPGIDRVRDLRGRLYVEHRADLGRWLPKQFGTLDVGVARDDAIFIDDLKYGQGVEVSPVDNKQLKIYALGFWDNVARHLTSATDFVISIDQPRAGGIKVWETTLDELLAFGEELRAAGERTYLPDAPFKASKKGCQWCRVKDRKAEDGTLTGCKTYDTFMLDFFGAQFDDLDDNLRIDPPKDPTPLRRSKIVRHADIITKWLARIHEDSVEAALAGNPDPGLKLVAGRKGHRKWFSEQVVEPLIIESLRDDAFTRKLKTPAEVEKLMLPKPRRGFTGHPETWAKLSEMIDQPEGAPKLVPEDDDRPALASLRDQFEEL